MPGRSSHFCRGWERTTRDPESAPRRAFPTSFIAPRTTTATATTIVTMAEEQYKDYLAARVLTEHKPVTYRLLSRALKTNVNTAKQSVWRLQAIDVSSPQTGCSLSSIRNRMRANPVPCTPPTSSPVHPDGPNTRMASKVEAVRISTCAALPS